MIRVATVAPLAIAIALVALVAAALSRVETGPDGPLTGQALPAFTAPPFNEGRAGLDVAAMVGAPYVLNAWASWCAPCRAEHSHLERLAAEGVAVHGLVWRDSAYDAQAFLDELGDPFSRLGLDQEGVVGERLGVTGAPETLIVGADGVVAAHIKGPLTPTIMAREVRPLLVALGAL